MWGKKKTKSSKIETLIGTTMEIQGDLIFTGGLHVDGKILGNVIAGDDSHSMLILSDQGQIEGEVRVPYVVLNGQVTGNVYASERVELSRHGQVKGNVYYNLLEMAMGAEVNGNLVHCKDEKKLLEFQSHKSIESDSGDETGDKDSNKGTNKAGNKAGASAS